jgi:predicted Zn-dependent protease
LINRVLAAAVRPVFGLVALLTVLAGVAGSAAAQGRDVPLIRDAEIEATIRAYADPLFRAAGLDAAAIKVHLLQDDRINAFVAPGMNMFINTGLLMRADGPNQVIGVIAHETGHIAGGHLVRIQDELHNATVEAIAAMLLGAGAGIASGKGEVGMAAAAMGQSIAQRDLLKYSRVQEASADQAGMGFLDATHQSSRGMLEFFQKLEGEEFLLVGNQDPYVQTHPLTRDRIESVQQHVDHSPYSDAKEPPELVALHERMLAKLRGYIWPLDRVLQTYPLTDTSVPARYARSIAYFRVSRLKEAMMQIDSILQEQPDDAFFLEQKGQFFFQNGRLADALPLYQKAADLKPHEALIRQELGWVELETEQQDYVKPAVGNLEFASRMESNDPTTWQLLAVAYGRDGQLSMSSLAQAEQAMASGNKKEARLQARRALKGLPAGSAGWLRANDIVSAVGGNDDENQE